MLAPGQPGSPCATKMLLQLCWPASCLGRCFVLQGDFWGLEQPPFQVMEAFYTRVAAPGSSGATFLAVCRGKVRPLRSGSHTPGCLSPPGTCA